MSVIPMFPLGSVLLPTMVLPLHIFEPRYRQLVSDALSTNKEFGVCLIERGSEVGGGETRSNVGTIAQIVDAQEFPDGRWAVAAVGTRTFGVQEWLADDPYPRARVEYWKDDAAGFDLSTERDNAVDALERVRMLGAEFADPAMSPYEITAIDLDPTLASYQLAGAAPLGPFDRQRLLAIRDTAERLVALADLLGALESDLRSQQP